MDEGRRLLYMRTCTLLAMALMGGSAHAQGITEKDLFYSPFELAAVTVEESLGAWEMANRTQFVRTPYLSDVAKSIARSRGEAISVVFGNSLPGSVAYFGMPAEPMLRNLGIWSKVKSSNEPWGYTLEGQPSEDICYNGYLSLIHCTNADFNEVLCALARAKGPKSFWRESGNYRNVSFREEKVEIGQAFVQSANSAGASAFADTGFIGYIWQRRPQRVVAFNPATLDRKVPDQEARTFASVADALDAVLAEHDVPFLACGDLDRPVQLKVTNGATVRSLLVGLATQAGLTFVLSPNGILLQNAKPEARQ